MKTHEPFNSVESRNKDEKVCHVLLLASLNQGGTADWMYSNVVTIIEESHVCYVVVCCN